MFSDNVTKGFVIVACAIGIVIGGLAIASRVHSGCFLGTCALVLTK